MPGPKLKYILPVCPHVSTMLLLNITFYLIICRSSKLDVDNCGMRIEKFSKTIFRFHTLVIIITYCMEKDLTKKHKEQVVYVLFERMHCIYV